jgi:hypothetical protein
VGRQRPVPIVLDAGALIALESGGREVRLLIERARERGAPMIVPAGVLGQVWRGSPRQVPIARVVNAQETLVEALDDPTARVAGMLCGAAATSDVIDATVVIAARRHAAMVVTSDPDDLRRIDPGLVIHAL